MCVRWIPLRCGGCTGARREKDKGRKKERKKKMEKAERRRNNNKTKKRGAMLGGRGGEERQAWRAEKNLTGSSLVGLGSPNNSVRPLNKQQFGVIARHPR